LINFVSNLSPDLRYGGFSALNAEVLHVIRQRHHTIQYVGPVNPPIIAWQKAISKLRRVSGIAGDFFQFSQQRLARIAREVDAGCAVEAQFDCFHGFTPWVLTRPRRPYLAWGDCTFCDYIDIYHRRQEFRADDLHRIEQAEAAWMKGASRIAFTSTWAAERAAQAYGLDPERVDVVCIFGESELPNRDSYSGAQQFAFASTNFEAKGGPVVLAAFRQIRTSYPNASLVIVGNHPRYVKSEPGVIVLGFLRKEDPKESARYREILAQSRVLVHPTRSDIAPMVTIEAAYFGCPAVASRQFAIPELVDDECTGILVDDPSEVSAVADAMMRMLSSETRYRAMRKAAWTKARKDHSKAAFQHRFLTFLEAGACPLFSVDHLVGRRRIAGRPRRAHD